jgi:CRP/FNR family transcriptional regulator, cyclic AMP receptor protein
MADEPFHAFLSRTPFFAALEPAALALVEGMLLARTWPAGATVFREGDQGNSLYVIKRGTAVVYHQGPPGEPLVKLTRLGPGDFFGEMTLIEMQPRSASVVAESEAELLELRAADLYRLYKQDVKAYVLVLQNMNRELCRRLRRTNQRLVEWASGASDESTQVGMKPVHG